MTLAEKAKALTAVLTYLRQLYGPVACPLYHRNIYELLVAVVLSAQCRDDRVNFVTPDFFAHYPTPEALAAETDESRIGALIASLGLYRAKARNLLLAARYLVAEFGGQIPANMTDLLKLPGVGRKTANVLLSEGFGLPGFAVDTHVFRLLNLLGIIRGKTPEELEKQVKKLLPPEYWRDFSLLLITHGRRCCTARRPNCAACGLAKWCRYAILKAN